MKFAFSTLGCPDWSFGDIVSTAKDTGFDGIEIRGIGREIYVPNTKPFLPENIGKSVETLKKTGLEISCLSSDNNLNERFKIDSHMKSAKEHIDLAAALKVRYVRVLIDSAPAPAAPVDFDAIAKDLRTLAAYAGERDVTVLVETNGAFADSSVMLKMMEAVDSTHVAVLWDVHHPFRFFGEPVGLTYDRLKEHICYVHVKDSLVNNGNVEYQMMGYGDVPILEAVKLLRENRFSGYVTLEWLKRWCADLAEPGIVFPHFLLYLKNN